MRQRSCIGLFLSVSLLVACAPRLGLAAAVISASTIPNQGYPPLPATAAHPAGYPAPTMAPTMGAAQAAAIEQTNVAAATATTAGLIQTLVAQGTPPSPGGPQLTPPPMPTRLVVTTRPDCSSGADAIQCHDAVLGLKFAYPSAWGQITAQLFTGDTGSGYEYQFSSSTSRIVAGGRSRDFSEGRDRMLTDFGGWDSGPGVPRPEDSIAYGAIVSNVLQANIVLVNLFPAAHYVCNPDPGIFSPIGILEINLPASGKINGFVFAAPILSDQLESELAGILGVGDQSKDTKCLDAALQQHFDAKVKAIIDAIKAGTVDSATQANISQLLRLAQSIRFD
jgi:hypothetical protein